MKEYYGKDGRKVIAFKTINSTKVIPIYEEPMELDGDQKIIRDKISSICERLESSFKDSHRMRIRNDIDDMDAKLKKLPNGKFKDRMQGWLKQIDDDFKNEEERR